MYAAERKKDFLPFATACMELESIMLSEISQAVKDKYHTISPVSGTSSTKQISKQNINRDIEIKNKLTVTIAVVGGYNGGKGRKVFRNIYKGHMDKTKRGWNQGREVEMVRVGREWWEVNADNCT